MHDEPGNASADQRLLESEQRYQAVIENASDMIQSVRPDGTSTLIEYLACDSDCTGFAGAKYKIRSMLRDISAGTIARGFTVIDAFDRPRRTGSYALEGGLITQLTEYDVLGRVARSALAAMSGPCGKSQGPTAKAIR